LQHSLQGVGFCVKIKSYVDSLFFIGRLQFDL
jgi:hypothetical protein